MMKKVFFCLIIAFFLFHSSYGQHEHHGMNDTGSAEKKMSDTAQMDEMQMDMGDDGKANMGHHNSMSHVYSLNLPMNRNGSGTAWLPDASPMYGYMFHTSKWMYMLHGNLFLRYNNQDFAKKGSRGDKEFDAPDWVMFMGQ